MSSNAPQLPLPCFPQSFPHISLSEAFPNPINLKPCNSPPRPMHSSKSSSSKCCSASGTLPPSRACKAGRRPSSSPRTRLWRSLEATAEGGLAASSRVSPSRKSEARGPSSSAYWEMTGTKSSSLKTERSRSGASS